MLQPKRHPLRVPPRRPSPAVRPTVLCPFDCHRCLLHVEFRTDGESRPEGWQLVLRDAKMVWRCVACVREVAAGSREEL